MHPTALAICALIAYALASWLSASGLRARPQSPPWAGLAVGSAALALHAMVLFDAWPGPNNEWQIDFVRALSLVGGIMALLVVLSSPFSRVRVLLIAALPIASLGLAISALWPAQSVRTGTFDWRIQVHVGIALAAYSVLSLAALQAAFLGITDIALKQRKLNWEPRLFPPLSSMEQLLFQLIAAGFTLLTLTILAGVLFIHDWFAQHLIHKTVLTFAAWLIFGGLLFGRWRYGWRGMRAVRLTLAGMALLLLAFFGSKFVLEHILERTV